MYSKLVITDAQQAGLAIVIIDPIFAYQIPLTRETSVDTALGDIIRNMVVCALWIPYFLKSERVQATFVR
ncbi:DUF2569 family protein [Paenibacillus harenae]|uniref:DUF2569 family protein n=1 Tax=Paenibacillus harenae TaxID=306543 RepID=UPI0027D8BD8C|nr:DUF2569 family protein [Paenibacillus harenae]